MCEIARVPSDKLAYSRVPPSHKGFALGAAGPGASVKLPAYRATMERTPPPPMCCRSLRGQNVNSVSGRTLFRADLQPGAAEPQGFCSSTQGEHALVNPVLRGAWYVPGAVQAARQSTDSAPSSSPAQRIRHLFRRSPANVEALPLHRLDELTDRSGPVLQQIHRQRVAELDALQLMPGLHRRTVAGTSDTLELVARYAGKIT